MSKAFQSLICLSAMAGAALSASPQEPRAAAVPQEPASAAQEPVLAQEPAPPRPRPRPKPPSPRPNPAPRSGGLLWEDHFDETVALWDGTWLTDAMRRRDFSPVVVGRMGGDDAGDVGVWVRRHGGDPSSAMPALSLRRQGAETLPAEEIRIHAPRGGRTVEKTLAKRLAELGLSNGDLDRGVEVSRQLAIIPVPDRTPPEPVPEFDPTLHYAQGAAGGERRVASGGVPPYPSRATFNFSVNVDGAAYVIADGPAGGGEAVAPGGGHRLLFADVGGRRAPFTASAAAQGPPETGQWHDDAFEGLDVQPYCIIQIPLRPGAKGLVPGDLPAPPRVEASDPAVMRDISPKRPAMPPPLPKKGAAPHPLAPLEPLEAPTLDARAPLAPAEPRAGAVAEARDGARAVPPGRPMSLARAGGEELAVIPQPRFERISFGLGGPEGPYSAGAGFRGNRAPEPVRVTYVYFVAPKAGFRMANADRLASIFGRWGDGWAARD